MRDHRQGFLDYHRIGRCLRTNSPSLWKRNTNVLDVYPSTAFPLALTISFWSNTAGGAPLVHSDTALSVPKP